MPTTINIDFKLEAPGNNEEELREIRQKVAQRINDEPDYQADFKLSGGFNDIVVHISHNVIEHKEFLTLLIKAGWETVKLLAARHKSEQVEVTVSVDGATLVIKGVNQKGIKELVNDFQTAHPQIAEKVGPESKLEIQAKTDNKEE